MNDQIAMSMEAKLAENFSMAMLLRARPDAAELIKQAFRLGFADGCLWQVRQIRDMKEAA